MRRSPRKTTTKATSTSAEDKSGNNEQKVILLKDVSKNSSQTLEFVQCRHPKTGIHTTYMFDEPNDALYEIMKFQEEPRSWFIDDSVQKDGSFYITTPMDRLFLFLPYLITETKLFQPIEQILFDKEFPIAERLLSKQCLQQLLLISDVKRSNDTNTYRYNQEKCLCWMVSKAEHLANVLESRNIHVGQGSVAATFIKSARDVKSSKDDYLHYACGLICGYLPQQVSDALMLRLGVPLESPKVPSSPPSKKMKSQSSVQPDEDYMDSTTSAKQEKPKKMSSTQKALDKVDKKGMKNISSFFSRPK